MGYSNAKLAMLDVRRSKRNKMKLSNSFNVNKPLPTTPIFQIRVFSTTNCNTWLINNTITEKKKSKSKSKFNLSFTGVVHVYLINFTDLRFSEPTIPLNFWDRKRKCTWKRHSHRSGIGRMNSTISPRGWRNPDQGPLGPAVAVLPDRRNSYRRSQINRISIEGPPKLASEFTKRLRSSPSSPDVSKWLYV